MKRQLFFYTLTFSVTLLTLLISCSKPNSPSNPTSTIPVLTTANASTVTQSTALSGGTITSDGGATVTARGVCWNTTQNPTTANSKTSDGTGTGSFTSSLTGLSANTTYYIRTYATNSAGTSYGNEISFTSLQVIGTPVLTTTTASIITQTTAQSGGSISSDGGATVTARGVCWSTSQNPTTANSKTSDGTGTGSFTSSITGLAPGVTYYIMAYATNSIGTAYGNQITTTTPTVLPSITTTTMSAITATTATSGGNITSDGGAVVRARGVCWSTSQNPTIANNKTTDGTGTGSFTSNITGLSANTTYYIRSYATNSTGTAYGNDVPFTTQSGSNGNVTICSQIWMTKNLDVTTYRNGDPILQVTDNYQWNGLTTGAWCYYNNDPANGAIYGKLYNWYAVNDPRGLAPQGWHIPSDAEWTTLTTCLGGEIVAGSAMKEVGATHWGTANTGATNSSGFAGLPGGVRGSVFGNIGNYGNWWSSTESNTLNAWGRSLSAAYGMVARYMYNNKKAGFSVRCLRD
jgi:uncharacterized protein (TIGR02145 family)